MRPLPPDVGPKKHRKSTNGQQALDTRSSYISNIVRSDEERGVVSKRLRREKPPWKKWTPNLVYISIGSSQEFVRPVFL
jgi:hypothetical protein